MVTQALYVMDCIDGISFKLLHEGFYWYGGECGTHRHSKYQLEHFTLAGEIGMLSIVIHTRSTLF